MADEELQVDVGRGEEGNVCIRFGGLDWVKMRPEDALKIGKMLIHHGRQQ